MPKHDFESVNKKLMNLKESFDIFLKSDAAVHSFEKAGTETEFGKEVIKIFDENKDNSNAKNLDFQYRKIIQIANDIQHLKQIKDNTLPDWLEDELENVFKKIKALLKILEEELN